MKLAAEEEASITIKEAHEVTLQEMERSNKA